MVSKHSMRCTRVYALSFTISHFSAWPRFIVHFSVAATFGRLIRTQTPTLRHTFTFRTKNHFKIQTACTGFKLNRELQNFRSGIWLAVAVASVITIVPIVWTNDCTLRIPFLTRTITDSPSQIFLVLDNFCRPFPLWIHFSATQNNKRKKKKTKREKK